MFNFFNELCLDYGLELGSNSFNIVNVSNKLVYVEGLVSIVVISKDIITFKVKKGFVSVFGLDLKIKRITKTTLTIAGKINKIESGL